MTYEQIVAMMQTYYANADATKIARHYAVQVNVIGEGEGAFYIEVNDGKVNVQPYDYVDRNASINVTAETLTAIIAENVKYSEAVHDAQMTIDGDEQVAAVLDSIRLRNEAINKESVIEETNKSLVKDNNKSTVRKPHARKRAIKKVASKTQNSKKAK